MKNLLWIPFREEGNLFLLGKKKKHNLHFHPQSFYTFVWLEFEKQKKVFCFEALTPGQNSSVLSWETEIYFLSSFFGPRFNRPTAIPPGRRSQRRAIPSAWCLSCGRTEEKPPLLTQGSWWAKRTSPALTQRKSTELWWTMWILLYSRDRWTREPEPAAGSLVDKIVHPEEALTVHAAPGLVSLGPVGTQQRAGDVCTCQGPASERKRLTLQPLSLAKQKTAGADLWGQTGVFLSRPARSNKNTSDRHGLQKHHRTTRRNKHNECWDSNRLLRKPWFCRRREILFLSISLLGHFIVFWGSDLKHYRANISLMEKNNRKLKKSCIP